MPTASTATDNTISNTASGAPAALTDQLIMERGTTGYKLLVSDIAKAVVELYSGSSLAGSSQSVKNAIDSLNSRPYVSNDTNTFATFKDLVSYCRSQTPVQNIHFGFFKKTAETPDMLFGNSSFACIYAFSSSLYGVMLCISNAPSFDGGFKIININNNTATIQGFDRTTQTIDLTE